MCKSLRGGQGSGGVRRENQLDMAGRRDRKYAYPHIFLPSHVTEQKDSARKLSLHSSAPGLCRKRRAGGLDF